VQSPIGPFVYGYSTLKIQGGYAPPEFDVTNMTSLIAITTVLHSSTFLFCEGLHYIPLKAIITSAVEGQNAISHYPTSTTKEGIQTKNCHRLHDMQNSPR
jgi:hypothetical protein